MPQITWQRLCKDTHGLHLIVGALPATGARQRDAFREELIARLVAALKPKGLWATITAGSDELIEIHVAFDRRSDAERVAVVTDAKATGRYSGWASQRRFVLNRTVEANFAKIVGAA
jgi:hypothetical protein